MKTAKHFLEDNFCNVDEKTLKAMEAYASQFRSEPMEPVPSKEIIESRPMYNNTEYSNVSEKVATYLFDNLNEIRTIEQASKITDDLISIIGMPDKSITNDKIDMWALKVRLYSIIYDHVSKHEPNKIWQQVCEKITDEIIASGHLYNHLPEGRNMVEKISKTFLEELWDTLPTPPKEENK